MPFPMSNTVKLGARAAITSPTSPIRVTTTMTRRLPNRSADLMTNGVMKVPTRAELRLNHAICVVWKWMAIWACAFPASRPITDSN